MKKFLAIYLGSVSALDKWRMMDEEKRRQQEKAGKEAWGKWVKANENYIVDHGSPVGKTKRISAQGISDTRNWLGAYTIVQAESHEAAANLFENHPHFMIFPGQSVEVMECLPMPEMERSIRTRGLLSDLTLQSTGCCATKPRSAGYFLVRP